MSRAPNRNPVLRLRLLFGETMLGPGKAELLERIQQTGSISAAGRAMGMSYKRAWMLVEEMNDLFTEPLVDSARGGPNGGGAQVTDAGRIVLGHFRALEAIAAGAGADHIAALKGMIRDIPDGK